MRGNRWLKVVSVGLVLIMGVAARAVPSTSSGQAGEPNSVGEILKGNKLDWIAGEWETTTLLRTTRYGGQADANETPDKNIRGQVAEANFEWTLDGYALSIRAKVGRYEYEGMAYYVASSNTIVNKGVDNRGRSFGGSWLIDGDKLLLKIEQTGRDGSINNFDRFLSKVDENTMKSVTYAVTDGKRSDEPAGVLEFKRKK